MLEIFTFDFMQRAFVVGALVSILAPAVGLFIVVKRLSPIADTLSHVSLAGIAPGLLFGFDPVLGAMGVALLAAILIEKLRKGRHVYGESALTLFFSGGLAVAIVLLSLSHGINADLFSYLFGSITTVSRSELMLIGTLTLASLVFIALFYEHLFTLSFNEDLAESQGVRVRWLNLMLMIVTALTVAVSLRVVGALLIGALMVIPVITAMQIRVGFLATLSWSVLFSFIAVMTGLMLSYYGDVPSGATIVLISITLFSLSLFWNRP